MSLESVLKKLRRRILALCVEAEVSLQRSSLLSQSSVIGKAHLPKLIGYLYLEQSLGHVTPFQRDLCFHSHSMDAFCLPRSGGLSAKV